MPIRAASRSWQDTCSALSIASLRLRITAVGMWCPAIRCFVARRFARLDRFDCSIKFAIGLQPLCALELCTSIAWSRVDHILCFKNVRESCIQRLRIDVFLNYLLTRRAIDIYKMLMCCHLADRTFNGFTGVTKQTAYVFNRKRVYQRIVIHRLHTLSQKNRNP